MPETRRRLLVILATTTLIAVAVVPAWRMARRVRALDQRTMAADRPVAGGSLRDALAGASGWVIAPAPTPEDLAGRPILALIWSDTDPAAMAGLGVAEAWREAYERFGLAVVGIHEPAFAFSADSAAPARAARRAGARFPIALDPSGELRRKLGDADDLPQVVVADTSGIVVWRAEGLDRIASAEATLRELVARLHPERRFPAGVSPGAAPLPPASGSRQVVYLGNARVMEGPLAGAAIGKSQPFTAQFRFQVEGRPLVPYPVGWWTPTADGLTASRGGADHFVALRYEGDAVYVVASPPPGETGRLWVLRDEAWLPREALGDDARLDGSGASCVDVTEPRLYQVARGGGNHVLKLSPEQRGLTLHAIVIESSAAPRP